MFILKVSKKVREKSRECHNHKPQPFPDPKRKRKPTNLNSADTDHLASSEANLSGSTVFAWTGHVVFS